MKTQDVIAHYGSLARAAKAMNMSRNALYQWGDEVPIARQYELEVKTDGALISEFTRNRTAGTTSVRRKKRTR